MKDFWVRLEPEERRKLLRVPVSSLLESEFQGTCARTPGLWTHATRVGRGGGLGRNQGNLNPISWKYRVQDLAHS